MPDPSPMFTVEYPCARHCRGELDLSGIHLRFTHGQMLRRLDELHDRLHRRGSAVESDASGAAHVTGAPVAVGGPRG